MSDRMVGAMWKTVKDNGECVYFVVQNKVIPVIEAPYKPEADAEDKENARDFAAINVFDTIEGAQDYRRFLVELMDFPPSSLKVDRITLQELWSRIDEFEEFAHQEYASTIEIHLLHSIEGFTVIASDVIFTDDVEQYN